MGATVEVLGAFSLIITVGNAILIVMLIQLSLLKTRARKLTTWIWQHGGYTSIETMRAIYGEGGMPISQEDTLGVVEDVVDEGDWSSDVSYLTDNDALNEKAMVEVQMMRNAKTTEASMRKRVESMYRERGVVERALRKCQVSANGQIWCPPVQ